MIWQNPWAWLGLAALAVPVLIHLLGRRSARVQQFPTLRFLPASNPLHVRRSKLTDVLLLALRLAIVLAAVAALAQPLVLTRERTRTLGRTLARIIIVDTSASMNRAAASGGTARAAARAAAAGFSAEASTHSTIETAAPAETFAGALAWLRRQPGRHEVVLISDFQAGTIEERDVSRVPPGTGLRFVRTDVAAPAAPVEMVARQNNLEVSARATVAEQATHVQWTAREAPTRANDAALLLLAGEAEASAALAARTAAATFGALHADTSRPVAIVFPGYGERTTLANAAAALAAPWMGALASALRHDAQLSRAALNAPAASAGDVPPGVVLARNKAGAAVMVAAQASVHGRARMLVFTSAPAGSLGTAALVAAISQALVPVVPATELEPDVVPEARLQQWQREPAARVPGQGEPGGASDGRWFWLLVLLLLGAETILRRSRREVTAARTEDLRRVA